MNEAPEPIVRMSGDELAAQWRRAFFKTIEGAQVREPLRAAALAGRLGEWTTYLTGAVVSSCESLGLRAAAKGHTLDLLPQSGQEYLGLDVTAFLPDGGRVWPYPVAVFELENSASDDRVGYSMWKVACVHTVLAVVVAYRKSWPEAFELEATLERWAPEEFGPGWAHASESAILLALGSRDEGEGFPWGYFKFRIFNRNTRRFEKL